MRAKDYEPDVKDSVFLICPSFLQECSFDLLLFPNILTLSLLQRIY